MRARVALSVSLLFLVSSIASAQTCQDPKILDLIDAMSARYAQLDDIAMANEGRRDTIQITRDSAQNLAWKIEHERRPSLGTRGRWIEDPASAGEVP